MRRSSVVLAALCLASPAAAQSFSRDWRPEDRTVVGDFSRVTAIATSLDRVFIASPSALLIWNPQFQHWEGSFDPPDPTLLTRVFTALADPLDNSLWLARPDGWVHYQPDIQLWDQGAVPEGILGIAFDQADPVAGLYLRTRSGWELLPRGGITPTPGRAPARPVAPTTVEQAIRSNPTLQANAAAILTDNRLRNVRYTAAARAFDNRGWYLGTSGLGALYLADGAPLPQRLSFGLPSAQASAVFSWPGGVWAATNRTPLADASLTFVSHDLDEFRSAPGPSAVGTRSTRSASWPGQNRSLWAATDLGVARLEPADGRVDMIDDGPRPARQPGVLDRLEAGPNHGRHRPWAGPHQRLPAGRADGAFLQRCRLHGLPGGRLGVGWHPFGAAVGAAPGTRPGASGWPGLTQPASPGRGSCFLGRYSRGALPRPDALARSEDDALDPWTQPVRAPGPAPALRADGPGFWIAGDRGIGYARLNTPPLRPLRQADVPGAVNDLAVDDDYLWVATDGGLVRFRLNAIRP